MAITASTLAAAITALAAKDPLAADDTHLVDIARRSVLCSINDSTPLSERLLAASVSTYAISRLLRMTASTIALYVNRLIMEVDTNPLFVLTNPVKNLHAHVHENAVNAPAFISKIQRIYSTRLSPEFPEPMSESQAAELMAELKTHFLDHFQIRIESAIMVALKFRSAISHTMKSIGEIAATALNKWVHGAISATLNMDIGPVDHTVVQNETSAFLFGITHEYNSNETEFNRMSATIGHYLAQHLDRGSYVVSGWQGLWTPSAIRTAVDLETTNPDRPWSTAMKYVVSYADRSNITNVIVLSELTYSMHADYRAILESDDRVAAARVIVNLMRSHAFMHAVRITRDVQENQESPLYGYALYPYTVAEPRVYDSWPSVCARVRKSLRDRETVEALLAQMRGAIASNSVTEVEVPSDACDTLMAEEWETGQLAVALNGDRRPEFLVRVSDYERMLLHGTAENPFDRQEVKTVEVVRIRRAV